MNLRRIPQRIAAAVLALLLVLPGAMLASCARQEAGQTTGLDYEGLSATTGTVIPTAAYDFTSAAFDAGEWKAVSKGSTSVVLERGTGLTITGGILANGNMAAYSVSNPLKGKVGEGFSVVINVAITGAFINQYESMFGFTATQDPTLCDAKFFCVGGSGVGFHLNRNGETGSTSAYYDIVPDRVLNMQNLSQYILTADGDAIKIYLNGILQETYTYTDGDRGAYSYDTVGFINTAEYFHLGCADNYWGQADMNVKNVALYAKALTAEEIAGVNAGYADFSCLNALKEEAENISLSNYDTSAVGWSEVYGALEHALENARGLNYFEASQQEVDAAAQALESALEQLKAFYRKPDLTAGLVSAYPLSGSGENLVNAFSEKVRFMNGTSYSDITQTLAATKQRITGTKLFDENTLHDRDRWDTSISATTGLKIPADAMQGATLQTGLTMTVSVYAETLYKPWARIFQLGTKASGDGYQNGTGIFFAFESGTVRITLNNSDVFDTYPEANRFCTIIAGEWITASIVFDPYSRTVSFYVSCGATNRAYGGIGAAVYHAGDQFEAILNAVLNGQDNWIGRSYWSTDGNQVAYAANLTVYNRVLSQDEIGMLHAVDDLHTLAD